MEPAHRCCFAVARLAVAFGGRLMRVLGLIFTVVMTLITGPLYAQETATLVADSVQIAGDDTLVAQGSVEIFHKGNRLKANKITYIRAEDRLIIEGPLVLTDDAGTLIIADQADLSADLTEGVLRSARLVLNQQLQLTAAEIMRVGGRYSSLGRSVVSSCKVCASNPTPLWEIRARRIVHDEFERQIYFDHAQLRVLGVPVFYIPHLRLPDPTLDRATGFLAPSIRTTSDLGFGVEIPYFIRIGDNRDLTVTPFLSTASGRTLQLRYREARSNGRFEFEGAVSRDELVEDETRFYLDGFGAFEVQRGFKLSFAIQVVSDDDYLLDYDISEEDRLDSRIELSRTRRNEHISARLISFKSLRSDEVNSNLPSFVGDVTWQRRFSPALIGGEGGFQLQAHSHFRSSNTSSDSDGDGISDGRDTSRLSVDADWRRNWILPGGVLAAVLAEVDGDVYSIEEDDAEQGTFSRAHGAVAVEFRWPWTRSGASGVGHVIEPVAQFVWAPRSAGSIPNEDSVLVEFDEGNLFSLSRFSGADGVELGPRANLGLMYRRVDPMGWSLGLALGQVIRVDDFGQFSSSTGLQGSESDWLAAIQLTTGNGIDLTNRLVFDDSLSITKAEFRVNLEQEKYNVASSFIMMKADASESRDDDVSELTFDGSYRFGSNWQGSFAARYDFETDRAARAGLNLAYSTECLKLNMSLSRRFTSTSSLNASTSFGLSVDLLGFGGKGSTGKARSCNG
jgi:LPS-assembly protein